MKDFKYIILCMGLMVKHQLLLMVDIFFSCTGWLQKNNSCTCGDILLVQDVTVSQPKIWDNFRVIFPSKFTVHYSQLLLYLSIIILALLCPYSVKAIDDDKYGWMQDNFDGLNTRYHDTLVVPLTLDNAMQQGKTGLDLTKSEWVATGQAVTAGKALTFDWSTRGAIAVNSKKYKVLYRIDPRFKQPQIFIKAFNPETKKYEALDYPAFNVNDLDKDYASLALKLMPSYVEYFAFKNKSFKKKRKKISVESGDVINITLIEPYDFFAVDTAEDILAAELDTSPVAISMLYTNSNLENKIIYSSAKEICTLIDPLNNKVCQTNTKGDTLISGKDITLVGKPLESDSVDQLVRAGGSCVTGTTVNSPACYYDQGRGMKILVNNIPVKRETESFVYSAKLDKYFLYYKSAIKGDLDFTTDWPISQDMFVTRTSTLMADWDSKAPIAELQGKFSRSDLGAYYLHFGRYIMKIEIGNGEKGEVTVKQQQDIQVKYHIVPAGEASPTSLTNGELIKQHDARNAEKSGYLWLKVENPNTEVSGIINVNYASYTGSTWFSDIIYSKVVEPIIKQFRKFTKHFYNNLTKNASLQRIARLALVMYVCIYALTFLAGVVQITAKDLLIRILKITLIIILLGKDSWEFFNTYLFSVFTDGTYYIAKNVIGITSNTANIFGFIDPIFARYSNWQFWQLLFIELLQIHNGFTIIALMVIYSLTLYFRAILEVIVSYVIAYVGISVMISLAPFFFILLLFEKTKTIFDNWISTLFSYVIQPSILLIFFLLIDQIISEQLLKTVVKAQWGTLIDIKIGLDLYYLGIPFSLPPLTLPFLPGIPFFIPQPQDLDNIKAFRDPTGTFLVVFSSALLFYSFCLMAKGLVQYVTRVASQLTNVMPAMREGARQKEENPISAIVSDITKVVKPVKDIAFASARIFKDKVIDQNYSARQSQGGKKKEYTGKIFASRNDRDTQEPGESN